MKPMGSILRTLRFLVLLTLCCVASMVVSFHLVRRYAGEPEAPGRPDSALIAEANALRTASNGLLRLTARYTERLGAEMGVPSDDFREWVDTVYRPQLNEYRRGLLASTVGADEMGILARAADRVAAMTARPGDATSRTRALADVLRATQQAEERIVSLGMDRYLDEPREPDDFYRVP